MNKFKELQQHDEMAPRVMSPLRGRQKRTRKSERRAQAILVLGMHRSGTSAVTRVLNLLGADLPRNLLGSRPGNDSGHWESTDLLAIHDDILLSAGSAWDDWRSFDPAWRHSAAAQTYKEKILAILAHDFGGSKLFVIKDPRICRFAPFWLDVLRSFGSHPKVVIPIRDPVEVANSLKERDGFCVEKGYLLWLRHFLDAEQSTRSLPRALLTYDRLLSDWSAVAADVTSRTKIIWPPQPPNRETEIERFLASGLRHHVSSPEQTLEDVAIVGWVREAYSALLHMAEVGEDDTDMDRLDRVCSEFDKAALAFGPALAGGELELRSVRASLANSTGRVQELEAGIIAYRDEADRLREALDALRTQLDALRTQHDETSGELAVAVNRVQELDAGVLAYREEAERLREARREEAERHREALQVIYASHSWRLTAPLRAVRSLGTSLSRHLRERIHGTADDIYQILPGAMQARRQDVQRPPLPEPIDPVAPNEEPFIHTESSVVLVGHDGHPHGAQFLALSLLREFSRALRLRVECVLLRDGKLKSKYAEIAPVHSLNGADPRGGEARRLASELRRRGFQKAICNTTVSGLFAETLKEVGFEIVSLVHELPNLIEGYEGRGLKQEARSIARAADRIVFAAQPIAEKFQRYANFNEEKIWIQPQGLYKRTSIRTRSEIDEARRDVRKRLGLTPGAPVVLSVGFGDARKGVDLFVEIGQRVLSSNPDATFVWVGELDALIAGEIRNGLEHSRHARSFFFPGFSSDTDRFFASADVFALPSREDPFPTVLLEAIDAGLPVVSFTGVGGFEKLIQDNSLGLLVPAFDTASFANAVRTLIADGPGRHRTGSARRALVTREFSFQKYAYDLATLARIPVKRTSVIIPSFNYLQYLEARLASIAGQTLSPYEVIVLDDASTDGSIEWLHDNVHRICPDVELLVNERNSGSVFRQWLAGVERARGDYVWIAEADDLADPEFLEEVLRAFDDPDVVMSFCQSRQMASDGKTLCDSYLDYVADVSSSKWTTSYVNSGVDEILTALSIKNTIPNVSAVVFRRETLQAALKAKIENLHPLRVAGDWVTYIEVLQHGKIAFSPRSLNSHRRHSSSVTLSSFNLSQLREIMSVQQMVRDRFPVPESVTRAAEVYAEQLFQQFGLATDQMASIRLHPELTSLCVSNAHSGTG